MGFPSKIRPSIGQVTIGISALVWVLLLFNPGQLVPLEHCHVFAGESGIVASADPGNLAAIPLCSTPNASLDATPLQQLLEHNPLSSQVLGWGLMVLAMMLPKLILPIQLICRQSLRHYRFGLSMLFILGYVAIWMLAGICTIAAIVGLNLLLPQSIIPAIAVFIIAVVWQFSPIKQHFLNLGHDHKTLSAFGWPAHRDALKYGTLHGVWCVGSGWALMLFPMLLPQGHNFAMLVVTFLMLSEHLEHPRTPQWKFDLRLKLLRIIVAQIRIRAEQVVMRLTDTNADKEPLTR